MQQASKMGIHITMGSEDGLHFLVDTDFTVTSNPAYVIFLLLRSKILSLNPNLIKIQEVIQF